MSLKKTLTMTNCLYLFQKRNKKIIFNFCSERVRFGIVVQYLHNDNKIVVFDLKTNGKIKSHQFNNELMENQSKMADGGSVALQPNYSNLFVPVNFKISGDDTLCCTIASRYRHDSPAASVSSVIHSSRNHSSCGARS